MKLPLTTIKQWFYYRNRKLENLINSRKTPQKTQQNSTNSTAETQRNDLMASQNKLSINTIKFEEKPQISQNNSIYMATPLTPMNNNYLYCVNYPCFQTVVPYNLLSFNAQNIQNMNYQQIFNVPQLNMLNLGTPMMKNNVFLTNFHASNTM